MDKVYWLMQRDIPWQDSSLTNPNSPARPEAGVTEEMVQGVRFRRLAAGLGEFGPGSFWASETHMPPNKVAPMHHEHLDKLIYILEGSAHFAEANGKGMDLNPSDCVVMCKDHVYGIHAGPEGVRFLLVRSGDAPPILDE